MARKIYEKAIYYREQQTTRKVYQRVNNVLPTEIGENEELPVDEYTLTGVEVASAGEGYSDSFEVVVDGGLTNAVIAVTAEEGKIVSAEITEGGLYAADLGGEVEVEDGNGNGGKLTLAFSKVAE